MMNWHGVRRINRYDRRVVPLLHPTSYILHTSTSTLNEIPKNSNGKYQLAKLLDQGLDELW